MSNRYVWFLRGTTYVTAGTLGALILKAALPPMFTASSERALVNAPVIALTAPIDGMVERLHVREGDNLDPQATVAEIGNPRIDRATLAHLEIRLADIAERRDAAADAGATLRAALEQLEAELKSRRASAEALQTRRVEALKAALAEAKAEVEIAAVGLNRQSSLKKTNVVSATRVEEAEAGLSAAREKAKAARAALEAERVSLAALRAGVFVGAELGDLAALTSELRERRLELATAERTHATTSAHHRELAELAAQERERIDRRARSVVQMPGAGRITTTFANPGQDVAAGATLAHAVDCRTQRIVAIFPQRIGDELMPGREVSISGDGVHSTVKGHVERVLPHTSEMVDRIYAVPFPPIERRELYAVIQFERASEADGACRVGEWVTVSLEAGLARSVFQTVGDLFERLGLTSSALAWASQ